MTRNDSDSNRQVSKGDGNEERYGCSRKVYLEYFPGAGSSKRYWQLPDSRQRYNGKPVSTPRLQCKSLEHQGNCTIQWNVAINETRHYGGVKNVMVSHVSSLGNVKK